MQQIFENLIILPDLVVTYVWLDHYPKKCELTPYEKKYFIS